MEIDLTPTGNIPDNFEEIFSNIYISRCRKNIDELSDDDIYECNCNPLINNKRCDIGCLNRMYSAECNPNYCLFGNQCLNRRFQNKQWADVEIGNAAKKGWGLFARQNIKKNDFVIEYVGELVSTSLVKKRLKNCYFGSKKFFILSIGGGYLIDATIKGSKARFMNHSCSPNCVTQKWTVLGERCIGFFALRNINIGEELTFDYQFQRYGDAVHPCYCGEKNCRKFLGEPPAPAPAQTQAQSAKHNVNPVIIYRKMNKKVQLHRHTIYLKKLLNCNHTNHSMTNKKIFEKQIAKGIVCNKLQLKSSINYNQDYNYYNINCVQKYYQFDNLLYNMYHQNKELNLNQIRSVSKQLNNLNILQLNKLNRLNKLYGDVIDNINHQKRIEHQHKHKHENKNKNKTKKADRIPKRNHAVCVQKKKRITINNKSTVKGEKSANIENKQILNYENQKQSKENNCNNNNTKMDCNVGITTQLRTLSSDSSHSHSHSHNPTRKRIRSHLHSSSHKTQKRQKINHNAFASDNENNNNNNSTSKHKSKRKSKHKSKHRNSYTEKKRETYSNRYRHNRHSYNIYRNRNRNRLGHWYTQQQYQCDNNNNNNNNNNNAFYDNYEYHAQIQHCNNNNNNYYYNRCNYSNNICNNRFNNFNDWNYDCSWINNRYRINCKQKQ